MTQRDRLREALGAQAHQSWSGWMSYLFEKSFQPNEWGDVYIPRAFVERWKRQLQTQYCDLDEAEKDSDRKEAEKVLAILDLARVKLEEA